MKLKLKNCGTKVRGDKRKWQTTVGFRQILRVELVRRKNLSPKYSLRDFAKDLGFSPSHLCRVMKNKRGLSSVTAHRVSQALCFRNLMRISYRFLVLAECARSALGRLMARKALEKKPFSEGIQRLHHFCKEPNHWRHQIETFMSRIEIINYLRVLRRIEACGIIHS